MKTYKKLYYRCYTRTNCIEGVKNVKHSKRIRQMIKQRNLCDAELVELAKYNILHFENARHTPQVIHDGITHKKRTILVPTLEELLVQHCVVSALKPMFFKGMYEHSYASLPQRGAHKGKKVIEKWIKNDNKNTKYILKMDIYHFFDSVPHDILKRKLSTSIKDEKMLDLLYKIIDVTDAGIPLGFYTSQWFSNWFLQGLDHYIKEDLHAMYYMRYMDDMVIFGNNKKELHRVRKAIDEYLYEHLGLMLKSNWQVFLFDWNSRGRDLDFMGFRFYRNRTVLRKSIMFKACRKAAKINKKPKTSIHDARQMLSYLGWLKATDTYTMYETRIKPCINYQRLKRYISKCGLNDDYRIYCMLLKPYKGGNI